VGKYIPKEIRDKKLDLRKWKGHCKDSFAKLGYSGRRAVDRFIDDVRGI
jgi:hypothetical protein